MICTRMLAIQPGRGRTLRNVLAGLVIVCGGAFGQPTCWDRDYLTQPPGVAQPLWNRRLLNNGKLPQTAYYQLSEDILQITVEDGSRMNLTDSQMAITLATGNGTAWGAQVSAYNCYQKTSTITPSYSTAQPIMMLTSDAVWAPTTLVFSKPKWWGMVDMYSLDQRYFWPMWGGKIITIQWTDTSSGPFTGAISSYQLPASCPVTTTLSSPVTLAPCIPMLPVRTGEFFDWDNHADRVVFSPSGQWSRQTPGNPVTKLWGQTGDLPVPADYDFDGRTDLAVWRPSTGEWWITRSNDGTPRIIQWGTAGDVPLPADYDGDGRIDLAVWRPSTGVWWIRNGVTGAMSTVQWGMPGDVPVSGDFDGDGIADPAVWRPSTGTWWIWQSSTRSARVVQWGAPGDIAVPGDYDADGKTDLAVWRPSTGVWWFIDSSTGAMRTVQWGQTGDVPVPADYDGDGKTDIAIWRPFNSSTLQTGEWRGITSRSGTQSVFALGLASDKPVPTR